MRVPKVLATCDDEAVIGVPFYVMERVEGIVLSATLPEGLQPARIGDGADRRARRGPRRRLARVRAWRASASRAATSNARCGASRACGSTTRPARSRRVDEVTRWLGAHLPESGPATIVHGDYRLGNVMFTGDRLSAIFDWELATIGDPLADVGYLRRHLGAARRPGRAPSPR